MLLHYATAEFLDLHTHKPVGLPKIVALENRHFGQTGMPETEQWSAGIHPWYISAEQIHEASNWLKAQAELPGVIAIGECGLDKVCKTPFEIQLEAFRVAVAVAHEHRKPLIIHCVRAYEEVLTVLKKANFLTEKVVFHGFDKNWATAARLLDAGCSLSFGIALFREKSHAAEVLKNTPDYRLFLETDHAPIQIQEVYQKAAEIRSTNLATLRSTLARNWQSIFG